MVFLNLFCQNCTYALHADDLDDDDEQAVENSRLPKRGAPNINNDLSSTDYVKT